MRTPISLGDAEEAGPGDGSDAGVQADRRDHPGDRAQIQPVFGDPPSNVPVDWLYAIPIIGRVISPDACWAAAVDRTRADRRNTSDNVSSRNGGMIHSIRTHHCDVGKNQPPTSGPTTRLTTSEYMPKPTSVVM